MARFDLVRLVEGFRRVAGDDVAELARGSYSAGTVSDEEWARVFAAFGPGSPTWSSGRARRGTPYSGRTA
jgi:hypothetical protein